MNIRILLPAVLVVVCAATVLAFAPDNRVPSVTSETPDFSGKTLLIYTSPDPQYPTWIMADSRLKQIGNRLFLSGRYADTGRKEDWRTGLETHVAWDSVTTYQVLTADEYEQYLDDALASR